MAFSLRTVLGLPLSLALVACGTDAPHDASRLHGDVDPVGELGTFQLRSARLPEALAALRVVDATYTFAGLRVVPDGAPVKVKPGAHCLVASFRTVAGRADAQLSHCGIAVEKAKPTAYTLAAFVPKIVNARVDFGLKPWFRVEKVALDPTGGSVYRVPALQSALRAELNTVEGSPHVYRSTATTHVLSDASRPLSLGQGAVEVVEWALPERRRAVTFETVDAAKYDLVEKARLVATTRGVSGYSQSETLEAGTRATFRFFPDAALDSARLCAIANDCVSTPREFLTGAGAATTHAFRAEIFNFNAFETGVDGKVSIHRVAASGNRSDDALVLDKRAPTFSAVLFPGTYRFVFWRADAAGALAEVGESVVEAAR